MAAPKDIVEFVKNSILSLKEVLKNINEIEKNIENLSLVEESDKNELLSKTKQLVDTLFEKSSETKNNFYDKYEVIKDKVTNTRDNLVHTSSEYEDATSNINSEDTNDNDVTAVNVSDDETDSISDSPNKLKDVNKKSLKNKISSINSKELENDISTLDKREDLNSCQSTEDLIEEIQVNNLEMDITKNETKRKTKKNKKANKTANEELRSDEESAKSDTDQNNSDQSKTKDKLPIKDVESGSIQKKTNKNKNIENADELDKNEKQSHGKKINEIENQCNGELNEAAKESESEKEESEITLARDTNDGKCNSEMLEPDKELENNDENNEESVVIDDEIISPEENDGSCEENKDSDKDVNQEKNVEGNSEKLVSSENGDISKDSTILMETDTIKEENIEHNKENIETMPKIRLVSLDKLMEKPKKSVTFDSSIIILSSDDESSPQKSTKTPEKNSQLMDRTKKTMPKKIQEESKAEKVNQQSDCDDDTSSSRKSSRLKTKVEEKQKERIKLKSIFTRTKPNEWKGKNACESDSSNDDCNKNKIDKHSKKGAKKTKNVGNELYVPLPIIECEKLQGICLKDDNIFSVESILLRIAKRGSKRLHKQDSSNSSDSDKGNMKRKKEDTQTSTTKMDEAHGKENENSQESEKKNKNEDKTAGSEDESSAKKEQQIAKDKNDDSGDSENEVISKKSSETVQTGSSDSEDNFTTKKKTKKEKKKKKKVISDSEDEDKNKNNDDQDSNDDSNSSNKESGSDSDSNENKRSRRRIKRTKDSSESEEEISTRKQIRRLIDRDSLSETTKKAEAEEKERKARIAEKQKKYNAILGEAKDATVENVVLEIDEKTEKELLSVDPKLAVKLKHHQASGIRFMWDACFESLKRAKKTSGSGCILAHCMGLGKTLQVIALSHTLLQNSELTGVSKVLVVCPVNTVLNWKSEFKKWLPRKTNFEIFELVSVKQMNERKYRVDEWHEEGGILIIGYTMFRNISNPDNKRIQKRIRDSFVKGLVDPGPDLVVCDEGHLLKNEKTNLSIAMNRIKTSRRIVLTGTPLQNNLKEYWCMVQFIKPNLLGTYKEYLNRFVNPIINGQYTDSTQHDIVLMRKRSHVLHKLLDGVVQRRDYSVLAPYLPPKHEYVLFVRLSDVQVKLCQHYMSNYAQRKNGTSKVSFIFTDFQQLQRICTHPRVLMDKSIERKEKFLEDEDSEGSLRDFIDDGQADQASASSSSSSSSGSDSDSDGSHKSGKIKNKKQQKTRLTRAQAAHRRENDEESDPEIVEIEKEWWQDFCDGEELDNINNSGKLSLLFHLLKECEEIGDKILIFSQSLYTLNCIEYFLDKIDEATTNGETEKFGGYSGTWHIGLDYFRLDGSSSCDNRATWCDMFNSPNNTRARLFLISTKAGGLGINLVAANRVIIFDVSWNPSHDIQSIYRVYRFGQTKPCYIYRFVTYGAMEMKIYERQVTKQAISKRVIDEQQIDRHYNQNDLQELYKSEFIPVEERPIPLVPKDVLLGEMLQKYDKIIYKYHEHQSLLENKEEECLNEEERKAAWEEFENEKVIRKTTNTGNLGLAGMGAGILGVNAPLIAMALGNIVRRDNPNWSEIQVNGIIPALVQQLKVQLSENDTSMYVRVQHEIQRMQTEAREAEFQRQMRQMYAQTQYMQMARQQQNFATIRQMYDNMYQRPTPNPIASSSGNRHPGPANDVIELND